MEIEENGLELWNQEIFGCRKIGNNRNTNDNQKKLISVMRPINSENIISENTKIEIKNNFKIELNNSLGIDYNSDKKLRTGKYKIDKTIDFHGMTINNAFDLFLNSIEYAYNNGFRCILYITGKGNNSKIGNDTIKESFKKWIKIDNVSNKIIKYTQATNKDGGSGAFYVLLKRNS